MRSGTGGEMWALSSGYALEYLDFQMLSHAAVAVMYVRSCHLLSGTVDAQGYCRWLQSDSCNRDMQL